MELENLMGQAQVTMHCASNRKESRGGHARDDYPDRDDKKWLHHTVAWCSDMKKVTIGDRPVQLKPLTDEVETVPLKKRVY